MVFNKKQSFFLASLIMLLVITIFIFTGIGCAQTKESQEEGKYPIRAIDLIVAYSAGGGTDTGARLLVPYLKEELGVPINIINITGAGGWVGWTELINREPDGYTIGYVNTPSFTTGYTNPEFGRDPDSLKKIIPISNHVQDTAAWAVLADSPFDSVSDVLEYAKENPGKLSITTTGPYSQHHMMALDINELGYEILIVHTSGAGEATTMALGGHVDILSASVGELKRLADEGTVKVLAVADTVRHEFLPEVPTFLEEVGYRIIGFSTRGIAAPAGISEEKIKILEAALKNAMSKSEHLSAMEGLGLTVRYRSKEDYYNFLKDYELYVKKLYDW